MVDILDKEGLKQMNTIGEIFDPEKHDALIQMEKEGEENGKIIEEHLKGYYLNDKVIRHAQVIVAK
jgi:molecular chaperone GrpE